LTFPQRESLGSAPTPRAVPLSTKKLGRILRMGHRVTGDPRDSVAGAGWEFLFVAVDARWTSVHFASMPAIVDVVCRGDISDDGIGFDPQAAYPGALRCRGPARADANHRRGTRDSQRAPRGHVHHRVVAAVDGRLIRGSRYGFPRLRLWGRKRSLRRLVGAWRTAPPGRTMSAMGNLAPRSDSSAMTRA
jgi:hypothetical protein